MKSKRADKKNFAPKFFSYNTIKQRFISLVENKYAGLFKVYKKDNSRTACEYLAGLMKCEKGKENMERMTEQVTDSDYKRYIHFLSACEWSAQEVNAKTLEISGELLREQKKLGGLPTGLIIDETSHLKKGDKSVAVKRQYAGVVGKVDNCQVSVHTSLSNDKYCTLVGTRLFLPEEWSNDGKRCAEAGIPAEHRSFKTKPQLALELVEEAIEGGVDFDFVGGDGLYGHSAELTRALDRKSVLYVLDVHKDECVYLEEPTFSVPARKGNKGRAPKNRKPDIAPIQLQDYFKSLSPEDFTTEKIRSTAKGWKKAKVHTVTVWHWDGKEEKACRRTLLITWSDKVKYSLGNGDREDYSNKEWAYFQSSRYWVERCFDDCKNELGMSGYQVTGWLAWQHHMALVLMASLYLLQFKLEYREDAPLISTRDARLLVIAILFCTQKEVDMVVEQMGIRHVKRQADIDRYYKNSV